MERIIGIGLDMNSDKLKVSISRIVEEVDTNIIGRLANKYGDIKLDNVDVLLWYIAKAGEGNHLEIGTLFGGSAIAVALMKQQLNQTGIIVCIDPLDGYYTKEDISGVPVTPKSLFSNIDKFKVGNRILVMRTYSQLCYYLDMQFFTAYIDGYHENGVPLHDWLYVKDLVSRYVIFDNWGNQHPDVQEACKIASDDPEWKCVYSKGITYVVERITLT